MRGDAVQTFPDDRDPDLYAAVLTASAAIGLVRQRGGRMVQDAEDVIEATSDDPSPLHAERLGWYPSETYAARIASGGRPLRCGV